MLYQDRFNLEQTGSMKRKIVALNFNSRGSREGGGCKQWIRIMSKYKVNSKESKLMTSQVKQIKDQDVRLIHVYYKKIYIGCLKSKVHYSRKGFSSLNS